MSEEKFMDIKQVTEKVALQKSKIYELISLGQFPKQIKISSRKSVWRNTEILAWMEAQYV